MYVEKLTMKDFRCFEQAEVTFVYPGKKGLPAEVLDNVTLLIGINGTGKTSVLKAVALYLLSDGLNMLGYAPYCLVRRQAGVACDSARITGICTSDEIEERSLLADVNEFRPRRGQLLVVDIGGSETSYYDRFVIMTLTMTTTEPSGVESNHTIVGRLGREFFHDDRSPSVFVLGYGATRRSEYMERMDFQRTRHPRFQRVAGLFEEHTRLYPLAAWYPLLESKVRKAEVRTLLNDLLKDVNTEFTGEFKDADALFTHNGVKLPFGALSDGFRSYIGLVADMLYHLNYVCPKKAKLTDLSGVVMIDDIDVHLHPKWQRQVVPDLAKTFPKLQFIITSHSPLVAGTLHAANIRVVEDNQIHEYTERIHGLSADQILLSSYFGLDSTRAPAAERKLNTLAKRVADTHDPAPAIAFLEELAGRSDGPKPKKKKP